MDLKQHKELLENHSLLVTNTIQSIDDLKIFMEHHVYAVWDFMSLAKSLQHSVCPSTNLWIPNRLQRTSSRLINDMILAEESDIDPFTGNGISHFDLYCQAMTEIGADTTRINRFLDCVESEGILYALEHADIPEPSREFMTCTFNIIATNHAHEICAAFTHGRETVIPAMFRRILSQVRNIEVPRFRYYLDRHVQIDGDDHGPAARQLMAELCDHDPLKIVEAERAAVKAVIARIKFWDSVEQAIVNS